MCILLYCVCVCVCVHACAQLLSHVWFFATLQTVAYQGSLSMEFFRQEYRSGLPFPILGDLLDPGIEPTFLVSPILAGRQILYHWEDHYVYIYAVKSLQLCPTLYNPIDSSPPGPAVPGILQARTLEWVAILSSNA